MLDHEVRQLADVYASIRPSISRAVAFADGLAAVVKLDAASAQGSSIERTGSSWAVSTGFVLCDSPLTFAPVEDLDGQFSMVRYNAEAHRVEVITDPFGLRSLYVAERDGKTYISTSVLALAKHLRAAPDRYGLSFFLRTGYQIGTLTNWQGISRLDPATVLSYTKAERNSHTYFTPQVDPAVERLDFTQTTDHALEVLLDSYRHWYKNRPPAWADLTGGFDTRLADSVLAACGIEFRTNTVGTENETDVRLASEVAQRAGWEWTRFSLPHDWSEVLPHQLFEALGWGDGQLDVLQLAEVLHGHAQKSIVHRSLFVGGGHELFRGYAWQQEFWNTGRSKKINLNTLMDMRWLQPLNAAAIFAQDPTPTIRHDLQERVKGWTAPYNDALNTTQLDALYLRKMPTHFGPYQSAADASMRAILPFFCRPVVTAAFSSNFRYRKGHRLIRHMIERLNPAVAAVPTTSGGPAQPPRITNLHRFAPYYVRLARKATAKIGQNLTKRRMTGARALPVVSQRTAARRFVLHHLNLQPSQMRSGSLYNAPAFERFIHQADDETFRDSALLGRVIAAELALREAGAQL